MKSRISKRKLPIHDAPGELWEIETKVNAIAQVLQAYNPEIQAEEMDFYGLGMIVRDLASELSEVRNQIEMRNPEFGTDLRSKDKKINETHLIAVSAIPIGESDMFQGGANASRQNYYGN